MMIFVFLTIAICASLALVSAHDDDEVHLLNSADGTYDDLETTECGKYTYFRITHEMPCMDLGIELDVTSGDPDIYVTKGYNNETFYYADKNSLTWSNYGEGVSSIIISHWDVEFGAGTFDVAIYNDCAYQSETAQYRVRAYMYDDPTDTSDILRYPDQAMNRVLNVENFNTHEDYVTNDAYHYYRFCLDECADIRVNLQNCISNAECPEAYSYPELFLSRTQPNPQLGDYQYNLWFLRHIDVNRTDPGGRDVNGYMTGTYYLAVYGWCTPNNYVQSKEWDGPCEYAATVNYNVTIDIMPEPEEKCSEASLIFEEEEPVYDTLTPGATRLGVTPCFGYTYYTMDVPDPCVDTNFFLTTIYENANRSTAEITIAQWPNTAPVFEGNKVWNGFEWRQQNITIKADDPGFTGGYTCGADGASLCKLFIGVLGYCTEAGEQAVDFELTVTQTPTAASFGLAMNDMTIAAGETKRFEFCASQPEDVQVMLQSYDDACECPDSYTNMEVGVSRTNNNANFEDKLWKLSRTSYDQNTVDLMQDDHFTRPGTYYVTVNAYCNADATCDESEGDCTCEPCSNYDTAKYSMAVDYVDPAVMAGVSAFDSLALTECPTTLTTCLLSYAQGGSCFSSSSDGLSSGAYAGIAIGGLIGLIILAALIFFAAGAFAGKSASDPAANMTSLNYGQAQPNDDNNSDFSSDVGSDVQLKATGSMKTGGAGV